MAEKKKHRCWSFLIGAAFVLEAGTVSAALPVHLVDARTRDLALLAQPSSRDRAVGALSTLLNGPDTMDAAKAIGFDARQLIGSMSFLNDQELHDLALRAEALTDDPVAGMSRGGWILIVILLLAVVVAATGGLCIPCPN